MKTEKWFDGLLRSFERDFDFRLETIILDITEKISKRMKDKKISRIQFAKLLKVSPPAVTKILNGTSNFTLKTLLSLADALDFDLEVKFREKKIVKASASYSSFSHFVAQPAETNNASAIPVSSGYDFAFTVEQDRPISPAFVQDTTTAVNTPRTKQRFLKAA